MFGLSSNTQILLKMLSERNVSYTMTSVVRRANSTIRTTLRDLKVWRGFVPNVTYFTHKALGKRRPSSLC